MQLRNKECSKFSRNHTNTFHDEWKFKTYDISYFLYVFPLRLKLKWLKIEIDKEIGFQDNNNSDKFEQKRNFNKNVPPSLFEWQN